MNAARILWKLWQAGGLSPGPVVTSVTPAQRTALGDLGAWIGRFEPWMSWLARGAPVFAPGYLAGDAEPFRCNVPADWAHSRRFVEVASTGSEQDCAHFPVGRGEAIAWGACASWWLLRNGVSPLRPRARVALLLKRNSSLYAGMGRLKFFGLPANAKALAERVSEWQPGVIAGPAEALRRVALAWPAGRAAPLMALCGAEMLWADQSTALSRAWPGVKIRQIYQCAEGAFGAGDLHGVRLWRGLGLVEKAPLAMDGGFFMPVRTEYWRRASPVVRVAVGDVLRCGRDGRIEHHGRIRDLWLADDGRWCSPRELLEPLFATLGPGELLEAEQHDDGAVTFRMVAPAARRAAFADAARARLARFGSGRVVVTDDMDPTLAAAKVARARRSGIAAWVAAGMPESGREVAQALGAAGVAGGTR